MPNKAKLALTAVLLIGAGAVLLAQPAGPGPGPAPRDPNAKPPAGPEHPAVVVSEQQEADLLRILDEKRPDEAKELKKLKDENPREYRFALARAWVAYQSWKDMPPEVAKAHEELARAKVEAWRVSREYLAATVPLVKDQLRARLQELLGQEFDADQTIREYRLSQLEDQLKRLRTELKDRADRRSQVIDQLVQDLISVKGRVRPDGRPRATMPASHPAEN